MPARKNNPFVGEDGAPKDGFEKEFFEWEAIASEKELKKLPKTRQEEIKKARKALAKRMHP